MGKYILKRNLEKNIKDIYEKYNLVNEICLSNAINWKDKNIRYKVLSDGSVLFFHKVIEKVTANRWEVLYGDLTINEDSSSVRNIKEETSGFGLLNHSLVLLTEKTLDAKEQNTLYIKFTKNEKSNIYLRFINEDFLCIYKNINRGIKKLDDYKDSKLNYFDLFFQYNSFGYTIRNNGQELFSTVLKKSSINEIEILINFENGIVYFDNEIFKLNEYVVKRYINNKYMTICSIEVSEENIEYEISDLEIGTSEFEVNIDEIYNNNQIILMSSDNKLNIYKDKIKFNTPVNIYKAFILK